MGDKLELLSPNLIKIVLELLDNQNLCKLLYYKQNNPLEQTTIIDTNILLFDCLYPYPSNVDVTTESECQLHIYYPNGNFVNNQVIELNDIFFDIILAKTKDIYLINNNGTSAIRAYEIMKEILVSFYNQSIDTIGTIKFKKFVHIYVNEKFDCIRLIANNWTL